MPRAASAIAMLAAAAVALVGFVSFATACTGGASATAAEGPWYFASFDEARAFVDSEAGQTMLEVVATVRLAS